MMMMGLFWGSNAKKETPPPPPQRELTEHEKLKQRLATPMELCYIFSGGGPVKANPEFSYLIRRIDDSVYKNNCHIREIKEMMKELLAENRELRKRVEQLEQQQANNARVC
jgi:hypothetical protein